MSQPDQIKAYRRRLALDQAMLAQALGIALPTISRYERGLRVPPVYFWLALDELARRLNRKRKQEEKRKEREARNKG